MQPKTNLKLDRESFNRIKKTALNMSKSQRRTQKNPYYTTQIPEEIGLQLTNNCNLRCKHCFEWSEKGYNRTTNQSISHCELPIEIIEQLLKETQNQKSNLFLWGGEPLVYKKWDQLVELLYKYERWTVLCTNGINLHEKIESLLKISKNLAILTSLEGFEKENDEIRGTGSFNNAISGIKEILKLQKAKEFYGKQSVHCTINDNNIPYLYSFMEYMEELSVDTVYFCFPWYISENIANKMDKFYEKNFSYIGIKNKINSWHSFNFHIKEDNINSLIQQMNKINKRIWNIRIRYQPALELTQVKDFVLGNEIVAQNKCNCLAIRNRMDVMADASVSACKLFSEFTMGNLKNQSLIEIWKGENFNKFRKIIQNQLMPVCSRCILLYLNGK